MSSVGEGGEEAPTGWRLRLSRRRKLDVKIISACLLTIRLGRGERASRSTSHLYFSRSWFCGYVIPIGLWGFAVILPRAPAFHRCLENPTSRRSSDTSQPSHQKNFETLNDTCRSSNYDKPGELPLSHIPGLHGPAALDTPTHPQLEYLVCDYVTLSQGHVVNLSRSRCELGSRLLMRLPVVLLINRL